METIHNIESGKRGRKKTLTDEERHNNKLKQWRHWHESNKEQYKEYYNLNKKKLNAQTSEARRKRKIYLNELNAYNI